MIEISWSLENARSEPDTAQDIIISWAVIHIKISAIMVSFCSMWGVGQSIKVPSVTWDHKLTVLTQLLLVNWQFFECHSFIATIHVSDLHQFAWLDCLKLADLPKVIAQTHPLNQGVSWGTLFIENSWWAFFTSHKDKPKPTPSLNMEPILKKAHISTSLLPAYEVV